jgi:hypothetical protein
MVKVYAIALAVGIVTLLVVLFGGAVAENVGRADRDPGVRLGINGKSAIGALIGFGMGGLSAEFSPIDFSWPVSLAISAVAALLAVVWVRYAVRQYEA